jgi:hypothetical protein
MKRQMSTREVSPEPEKRLRANSVSPESFSEHSSDSARKSGPAPDKQLCEAVVKSMVKSEKTKSEPEKPAVRVKSVPLPVVKAELSDFDRKLAEYKKSWPKFFREDKEADDRSWNFAIEEFKRERDEFKQRLGKLYENEGKSDGDKAALAAALKEYRKLEAKWDMTEDLELKYTGPIAKLPLRHSRNLNMFERFLPEWAMENCEQMAKKTPALGINTRNSYPMPAYYRSLNQRLFSFAQ